MRTALIQAAEELHRISGIAADATHANADSATLLSISAPLRKLVEDIEGLTVARGRVLGESWENLSSHAQVSPERLRKRWSPAKQQRLLARQPAAPTRVPAPPRGHTAPPRVPVRGATAED
ncbi:hypothetical protein ACFVIM_15045, partial [Streptomyces sp. NPDC057638]|uniref:hypothetical protein n=1 Tax=Streptomyces sp. NPDC057638 TaxID=3346190 RepID=UPI0036A95F93